MNGRRAASRRVSVWAHAILGLPLLVGCGFFVDPVNGGGTGGGGSTTGNRAYVVNATTSTVSGFAIAAGTLTALPGGPFSLGYTPQADVVSRNNNFLYVAGTGTLNTYGIASDGSLSQLSCQGCTVIGSVASLDVSPDGQWLFGLDQVTSQIDLWQLDSTTGALTAAQGAGYTITDATVIRRRVRVSSAGDYVIASLGTAGDVLVPFNTASGAFGATYVRIATGSAQVSDNDAVLNTARTLLFVARSGPGGGVAVYNVSGLSVNPVSGSPFAAGDTPSAVALDGTSTYVYTGNRNGATVSGYSIGAGGVLTALAGSPFASGSGVGALALDSTGTLLLATAAGGTPDLTLYTFDALTAGRLNASATAAAGTDPAGSAGLALTH